MSFAPTPGLSVPSTVTRIRFGGAGPEGLGHEDVATSRPRSRRRSRRRPVRGGVAVPAHDGEPRERQALLGADHVDDALPRVVEAEETDPVGGGVLRELVHHPPDRRVDRLARSAPGRHVVVRHREGEVRPGDRGPAAPQGVEGVEGALVDEVPVDPQQALASSRVSTAWASQTLSNSVRGASATIPPPESLVARRRVGLPTRGNASRSCQGLCGRGPLDARSCSIH
jgi:hypothetical protein